MESEENTSTPAPLLDLTAIPGDMLLLGRRLADTKFQIDLLGKKGWGELTGNLHGLEASGEWNGPDDALTFFSKIFPFVSLLAEAAPVGVWQVPTERVIGRSWRWWPEHLSASSEEKLRDYLSSGSAAEGTCYYFISALGLLLAAQGQGRVNYCRQRDIPFITARVTELPYPPADRFKLYYVSKGATRQSWVVLNDRYLQVVQWPRITLPALARYGVHSTSWPLIFPATDLIFAELHNPQPVKDFMMPCIDLDALRQKISAEQQAARLAAKPARMAIADMNIINLGVVKITLMFFFLLSLVAGGLMAGEGWAGLLSLLVCAVSGSLLLLLVAPIFRIATPSASRDVEPEQDASTGSTTTPKDIA